VPSVQHVTQDRAAKSEAVSTVYPQLAGSSCVRAKNQVGSIVWVYAGDVVSGYCIFAVCEIDFLTRSFVIVR
jgi:hypothetical protein